MIAWTHRIGDATHMVAFDSRMRKIADLIERGDDWTIVIGSRKMKVNGRGCADPIDFMERMLHPGAFLKARQKMQDDGWFMRFQHFDGETWEVWNAE